MPGYCNIKICVLCVCVGGGGGDTFDKFSVGILYRVLPGVHIFFTKPLCLQDRQDSHCGRVVQGVSLPHLHGHSA